MFKKYDDSHVSPDAIAIKDCPYCQENAKDLLRIAVASSEIIGSDTRWCTGDEVLWDGEKNVWQFCAIGAVKEVSDIWMKSFVYDDEDWSSSHRLGVAEEKDAWFGDGLGLKDDPSLKQAQHARHLIDVLSQRAHDKEVPTERKVMQSDGVLRIEKGTRKAVSIADLNDEGGRELALEVFGEVIEEYQELVLEMEKDAPKVTKIPITA